VRRRAEPPLARYAPSRSPRNEPAFWKFSFFLDSPTARLPGVGELK
jgi:hypothetical protein